MTQGSQVLTPLVLKTRKAIVEALLQDRPQPGQKLPTFRQWASRLGVSTFTVRTALESLRQQGVIEATEGSYTFLRRLPTTQDLASPTAADEPVEIVRWSMDRLDLRKIRQASVQRQFEHRFLEQNRSIRFVDRTLNSPRTQFDSEVLNAWLKREGPTLGIFPQTWLSFLRSHGLIRAIDSSMHEPFDPLCRAVCVDPDNDQLWLWPTSMSFGGLLVHRGWLERAGLQAQNLTTWTGLADAAQRLTQLAGAPALAIKDWPTLVLLVQQLACAQAGNLRSDWFAHSSDGALALVHQMLARDGSLRVLPESARSRHVIELLGGRLPLALSEGTYASELLRHHQAHEFLLLPMPTPHGETGATLYNVAGVVLSAFTTVAQHQAVQRYLTAWYHDLHRGESGHAMVAGGVAPALHSILADRASDHLVAQELPPQWSQTMSQLRDRAVPESQGADLQKHVLGHALQDLFASGSADIELMHGAMCSAAVECG